MPYTPPSRSLKSTSRDKSENSSISALRAILTPESESSQNSNNTITNSHNNSIMNSVASLPHSTLGQQSQETYKNDGAIAATRLPIESNDSIDPLEFSKIPKPSSRDSYGSNKSSSTFYFEEEDEDNEEKEEFEQEKDDLNNAISKSRGNLQSITMTSSITDESTSSLDTASSAQSKLKRYPLPSMLRQNSLSFLAAADRRATSSRSSSIEKIASSVTEPFKKPSEAASVEDVFQFTNASPQSYSYTLLSPNSLALRVNVLKRSLEILIDRPELLNSMNLNVAPSLSDSTSANQQTLDSMFAIQRNASSVTLSTLLKNTRNSFAVTSITPMSKHDSLQNKVSNGSTKHNISKSNIISNSNNNNKELINDLKDIIQLIENDISSPEPFSDTIDKTNLVSNLENFTLANITNLSKGKAMRINLLHALSTPFIETNGNQQAVTAAGLPYIKSVQSSVGLSSLAKPPTLSRLNSNSGFTPNNSSSNNKGFQFHNVSTKRAAPKAILTCDLESPWSLKNANDLGLLMFGVSKNSIGSLTLMDLVAPRSRDFVLNKLIKNRELVFSGEIIAISRTGGQGMAWTSLWAKRKENVLILIFEQIPCDAIDIIISKNNLLEENLSYSVKSYVETNNSTLFHDMNMSGLPLSTFIPSMNNLLNSEHLCKSSYETSLQHSHLINFQRYFTLKIKNSFIPCAVTSEPLDTEEESESSVVRLNVHCLHYIAGTFVISANSLNIMSFNDAIAKNLFGNSNIKNKSIDFILPSFSELLKQVEKNIPNFKKQTGLVLPEHYFRKLNAYRVGKSEEEKELLFLNSWGIEGLHLDGNLIYVDVQLRVIEDDLFVLWITYTRNSSLIVPRASRKSSVASIYSTNKVDANGCDDSVIIDDKAASTGNKTYNGDDNKANISEYMKKAISNNITLTDSNHIANLTSSSMLHRDSNVSENEFNNLPSQLELMSNNHEDAGSEPSSDYGISRENSLRGRRPSHSYESSSSLLRSPESSTTISKKSENRRRLSTSSKTSSISSSSSFSALNKDSSSSQETMNGGSSTRVANADGFKLPEILTEAQLLARENKHLEKIMKSSPYWPKKVGLLKREKKITDFNIIKSMGQGAYGKVSLCSYKKDPLYQVVIKAIIKERILVDTWVRDRVLGFVPSEIQIMNFMRSYPHPSLMQIVDYFEDETYYYLETPEHGDPPAIDLFDLIEVKSDMTELECKYIFYQCALGLAHLHAHGVVHRDIKDDNIIVDRNYIAKIIDFGSAAHVSKGPFGVFVGTIDYAAPEVLSGKPYQGKPQDVWAMGVLLYTLVFKENPFYTVDDIMDCSFTYPNFHDIGDDCLDLINIILNKDYNSRPTMNDILEHKWLQGFK